MREQNDTLRQNKIKAPPGRHLAVNKVFGVFLAKISENILKADEYNVSGDEKVVMPSYWWKCSFCGKEATFEEVSNSWGMAHFIWDELIPSSWDQSALTAICKQCGKNGLKITYEFPRKDRVELTVVHIVGIGPIAENYVPMMWETYPDWDSSERWFDFKYVIGRNVYGLNKAAVFLREGLAELFEKYRSVTGISNFP